MYRAIILLLFVHYSFFSFSQENAADFGIETGDHSVLGGLNIGDLAPEIVLTKPNGERFVLSEYLEKGEVVLVFYRGYWCGVCSRFLSEFENELSLLKERGVQVIAITPETYAFIDETIEKTKTTISVFSDSDNKVMKDYKVFFTVTDAYQTKLKNYINNDLAEVNDQDDAALPVPATYLIGKDQKIKFRHYDINYRKRTSVDEILNALND